MSEVETNSDTTFGKCHEHYPVGFDDGYALDCQSCGRAWPCGQQTHTALMDATAEKSEVTVRSIAEEGVESVLNGDFYCCSNTGEWVYKWADERLVLRHSDGAPLDSETSNGERTLPLTFGAEALSFITSLLMMPAVELMPNEQERFDSLLATFLEARDGDENGADCG